MTMATLPATPEKAVSRNDFMRRAALTGAAVGLGSTMLGNLTGEAAASRAHTGARGNKQLTVYGWAGDWNLWFDQWGKWFQQETGISVSYISGDGTALRQRIIAENAAKSDVFISTPADAYTLSGAGMLANLPWHTMANAPHLDKRFKTPQVGIWGYDLWEIGYNTNFVSQKDAPTSWLDLADSKWKGKLAMVDPTDDGSMWSWIVMAQKYGQTKAWDTLLKMYKNSVVTTTTPGDEERYLATGSAQVEPLSMGSIMVATQQAKGAVAASPPREGAFVMVNSMSVMKHAPNLDGAFRFIDFYLSKQVQDNIMNTLGISIATNSTVPLTNAKLAKIGLGGHSVPSILKPAYVPDWGYWTQKSGSTTRIGLLQAQLAAKLKQ
jgi:ABC-type Fe3+ transport system substrate-binding protein